MNTEQPIVEFPTGNIPLDQLHYDPDKGLHRKTQCEEVHGQRDAHEVSDMLRERAAALAAIHDTAQDQQTAQLEQLDGAELLEDMLGHLREMARRVRYRHYRHYSGEPITELDRPALVLEARAVRTLAHVIIGLYPAEGAPGPDHREHRPRYPWQDEAPNE
jgi:hypothetical protein